MPPLSFSYLLRRLLTSDRWRHLHVKAAVGAAIVTVLVLVGASWLIVPVESSAPHANITTFPQALWWSVETATTVGYGDFFPVTVGGRIIAGVTMLVGISAFSIITAAIATWFVSGAARRVRELASDMGRVERAGRADATDEMRALHDRFDRLERLLVNHGGSPGSSRTDDH